MCWWIKLHRKITEREWYSDTNVFRLFMHLLLKANYTNKKRQWINVNRWQLITWRIILSEELWLTEQQIRLCLTKLKTTNEITIKTTNKFSLITLLKYNDYQSLDEDKQPTEQPANEPTDNQQTTTTKEYKESKENNKSSKEDNKQVYWSKDINSIIDFMKEQCKLNNLVYESTWERYSAKNFLSGKFKEEISDIMKKEQMESIKLLIQMATIRKFRNWKENWRYWKILWLTQLYEQKAKVLNSYLQIIW